MEKHFQQLCFPYKMSHQSSQYLSCSLINEESGVLEGRENILHTLCRARQALPSLNTDVLCSQELGPIFSIFPKLVYTIL